MKSFFSFLMLLFSSCSSRNPEIYEVGKAVDSFIDDLKKKENVSVFGRGGGFMYDIEEIDLDFIMQKKVNIDQARKIIVSMVESLLVKINAKKSIRPYLRNYPFTYKNLNISLDFYDSNGKPEKPPNIYSVHLAYGFLDFSIHGFIDKFSRKEILREPYEESLRIYHPEDSSIIED